jgi:hypothetical protein
MSNRWGIPKEVEMNVLQRDMSCVYCGISFADKDGNRRTRKTWEHIINDIRINDIENIAVCCGSCNASKGNKKLEDWLKSKYCETKRITKESISDVVKKHLAETTTA